MRWVQSATGDTTLLKFNRMTKVVIIDDEQHSIDTLRWKLENYCPDVSVIAAFSDPKEGIVFLQKNKPDLLFLDIEMPLLNGFDVLEEVGEISFDVIFTTAYDKFGIKAVKINALDYLLKPVQNKELKEAVTKHLAKRAGSSPVVPVDVKSQMKPQGTGKVALASKESIEFVDPSEIVVCMASSNYTTLFMKDGRKKLISKTLREFEELLLPHCFFRPHNSHLVNLNCVREFIRTGGGYLVMQNDMKVPVSKNRKEVLLVMLNS
jgi:two-component system LytT family response regulator